MHYKFFSYIIFSIFLAISSLHATENKKTVEKTNSLIDIKEKFKADGGSSAGLLLIEKAINTSKNESLVAKNEIISLREELESIISAESFDEKKYMRIKSKINDVMIKSVENKDKAMLSLLVDLSTKDRKIIANILKNMFFVDKQ